MYSTPSFIALPSSQFHSKLSSLAHLILLVCMQYAPISALISFSLLSFVLIVHVYSVIEQASSVSSGLLAIIGTLNLSTQFIHSITSGSHCLKKPSRPSLAVLLVPSLITAMLECQNWISPGYKYRTRWRASYKVRTHNATVKELLWLAV